MSTPTTTKIDKRRRPASVAANRRALAHTRQRQTQTQTNRLRQAIEIMSNATHTELLNQLDRTRE